MHPRLAEEWSEFVSVYPDATHKTMPERVEFGVELDPVRYTHARTVVAILIPAGYRATGPDGFLVPAALGTKMGEALPASDAAGAGMPGWWLISFHMIDASGRSTWHPTADPSRGDNLIAYAASVESFLARGCN